MSPSPAAASVLSAVRLGPGWARTVPVGVVHDFRTCPAPAVSILGYAPRLTTMTFREWGTGGLRLVRTVSTSYVAQRAVVQV